MTWLDILRSELFTITNQGAKEYWPKPSNPDLPYFNYRFEHVVQVEREARRLIKDIKADTDVVLASVWLHDRFQPVFKGLEPHGEHAASWAREHLAGIGFPFDKVEDVCYGLSVHSDPPHTIPEEKLEARLLWDADKLTHLLPTEAILGFFTRLVAKDCMDNIKFDIYGRSQYTVEGIVLNELCHDLAGEYDVDRFYFEQTKERARAVRAINQSFYEALRKAVT